MNDSLIDDGVIKYVAIHKSSIAPVHADLNELDGIRTKLFDLGLIGAYPGGVGYGNVSIRCESGCIISGTSTGSLRELGADGYCYVRSFDIQNNTVHTEGPLKASSESMTHCSIYEANSLVKCVLHIHSLELWNRLLDEKYPSTSAEIPYGTPQMALRMAELVNAQENQFGVFVMSGHREGIVAYGESINSAFDQIKRILN